MALEPEPELRPQLRDEAVKFLVLRDVETRPELAASRASGLVFGRGGHRLGLLSDDNEELAFWNVEHNQRLATFSLRGGPGNARGLNELIGSESLSGDRGEPGSGAGSSSGSYSTPGRAGVTTGANAAAPSATARHFHYPRVALAGHNVAVLMPDDSGVRLIDPLSGAPFRSLPRRGSSVIGVLGDPGGQRLLTIEMVSDDTISAELDGLADWDPSEFHGRYQVNLWDPDRLDAPIRELNWLPNLRDQRPGSPGPPPRSSGGSGSGPQSASPSIWPLVAISPDGKTVAVAPRGGTWVRIFSGEDGMPRQRRSAFIPNQPTLSAIALGPNSMLATAGRGTVRIYDLDNPALPRDLPPTQTYTWLMRFNPQGSLLALAGLGQIELWDPVARSLVNQLPNSEQASDVTFSPDGRSLAAVGRSGATLIWTVIDSAMRTQLSGFDARPSSLAFSADGMLAGGTSDGAVWFWRHGRCPEITMPQSQQQPLAARSETEPGGGRLPSPGRGRGGQPDRGGRPSRGGEPGPASDRPLSLAFDVQDRLVAHNSQGLRVWPAGPISAQSTPIVELPLPGVGGALNLTPIARTPDGQTMVLVRSSAVLLWHAEKPEELIAVTPPQHSGPDPAPGTTNAARRTASASAETPALRIRTAQLAPQGDRIYLIDQPGLLHAWAIDSIVDGAQARVQARDLDWSLPMSDGASSLALRHDGKVLAVGDRAGTVTLLATDRPRVLERIKPLTGEVESLVIALAFSPNGQDLAIGSQLGTISIWSVVQPTKPRLRLRLPGHRGLVSNLAFDPRGQRLATATFDPLVEVWDLELIEQELARLGLSD